MTDFTKQEWFYMVEGEVSGPCPFKDLQEMIASKSLQPKALVWTEAMEKWKSADEIPGLVPGAGEKVKPALFRTSNRARVQRFPALEEDEAVSPGVIETRSGGPARSYMYPPVSTGEWMWTLFLTAVPIVNIICFLVWAFGANTKKDKATWAKAVWVWALVWVLIYAVFFGVVLLAPSLLRPILD